MTHYIAFFDKESSENIWTSIAQMQEALRDSIDNYKEKDSIFTYLNVNIEFDEQDLLNVKSTVDDSTADEIVFIYFSLGVKFHKFTRQPWVREKGFRHIIFLFGVLIHRPQYQAEKLLPLIKDDVILVSACDSVKQQTDKLIHTPNSINFPYPLTMGDFDFKQKWNKKLSPPGERTFLYAGRIVESKGIFEIIECFNQHQKFYPKSKLVLLGKANDASYVLHGEKNDISKIESYIKSATDHNCNIIHLGHLPLNSMLEEMVKCDILLSPSTFYTDDFGLSIAQAKAIGLPVIGTKWGAQKDFLNPELDKIIPITITDKNYPKFSKKQLLAAMNEMQVKEAEFTPDLDKYIFAKDWAHRLHNEIKNLKKTNFEFTSNFNRYRDYYLEKAHFPFDPRFKCEEANHFHELLFSSFYK